MVLQHKQPDLEEVLKKNSEELDSYIRKRISEDDDYPRPRIDYRAQEENEDILICAYYKGEDLFRERMSSIIEKICSEASERNPDPTEFSRVLKIIEKLNLKECAKPLLHFLSGPSDFLKSTGGYYKRDLFVHVMVAFQSIKDPNKPPIRWQDYLDDQKYAIPAYTGLIITGLDKALEHLPRFLETVKKSNGSISARDSLLHLFLKYRDKDVVHKTFNACSKEPQPIKDLLLGTTKNIKLVSQDVEKYAHLLSGV